MACQSDTCVIFVESMTGINPHVARYLLFHNVMETTFKYILSIAALTAALTLPAKATFQAGIGPQPGAFLFNDTANKNVTDFTATVGGHKGFPVAVHTTGAIDSGAGFANIKPSSTGGPLTDLIFTPADPTIFGDFSFRGELLAAGFVTVTVTDNQGNPPQTFVFGPFKKDEDFGRQGVFSTDGETIKSVEITGAIALGGFKEVKQIEFSLASGAQIPDGGATVMLLGAALSVLGVARRYLKS
jgi:hypothetical protein